MDRVLIVYTPVITHIIINVPTLLIVILMNIKGTHLIQINYMYLVPQLLKPNLHLPIHDFLRIFSRCNRMVTLPAHCMCILYIQSNAQQIKEWELAE